MADKFFIDTNILLYAIDRSDTKKQKISRKWISKLSEEDAACVSTQVLEEAYFAAVKKLKVPPGKARKWVALLDNLPVTTITSKMVHSAIDCSILDQVSFWDALILVSAETSSCTCLLTEDLNHRQLIRGIRVVNPFLEV